jgi:hypothetical protein
LPENLDEKLCKREDLPGRHPPAGRAGAESQDQGLICSLPFNDSPVAFAQWLQETALSRGKRNEDAAHDCRAFYFWYQRRSGAKVAATRMTARVQERLDVPSIASPSALTKSSIYINDLADSRKCLFRCTQPEIRIGKYEGLGRLTASCGRANAFAATPISQRCPAPNAALQ